MRAWGTPVRVGDQQNALKRQLSRGDYRKPEYKVQVTAAQKRVLEGATVAVTIDSRYFFGEPVANAKVKYRVITSATTGGARRRMMLRIRESNADVGGGRRSSGYAGDERKRRPASWMQTADGDQVRHEWSRRGIGF